MGNQNEYHGLVLYSYTSQRTIVLCAMLFLSSKYYFYGSLTTWTFPSDLFSCLASDKDFSPPNQFILKHLYQLARHLPSLPTTFCKYSNLSGSLVKKCLLLAPHLMFATCPSATVN